MGHRDPWSGHGWRYRLALIAWGAGHLCRVHLRDTILDILASLRRRVAALPRRLARRREPPASSTENDLAR